jgi:hypothetical protein
MSTNMAAIQFHRISARFCPNTHGIFLRDYFVQLLSQLRYFLFDAHIYFGFLGEFLIKNNEQK